MPLWRETCKYHKITKMAKITKIAKTAKIAQIAEIIFFIIVGLGQFFKISSLDMDREISLYDQ